MSLSASRVPRTPRPALRPALRPLLGCVICSSWPSPCFPGEQVPPPRVTESWLKHCSAHSADFIHREGRRLHEAPQKSVSFETQGHCSYSRLCFTSPLVCPQQTMTGCGARPRPPAPAPSCQACEHASRLQPAFPWKSSQCPASSASCEPKGKRKFPSFPLSRVVNVHSSPRPNTKCINSSQVSSPFMI